MHALYAGSLRAGNSAFDETIGVALWSVDLSVLSCVLQAVVPVKVDLEVVFVGQRIVNCFDQRSRGQDLLAHLIHGILYAGALVFGERLECDFACILPCFVELRNLPLNVIESSENLPFPASIDRGAEDTVPDFGQSGVIVPNEGVESRSGALQHQKIGDCGSDLNALAFTNSGFNDPLFGTIPEE